MFKGDTDTNSFEKAFKSHYQGAFRYAYRLLGVATLSEDVVQQSFLGLWKKLQQGVSIAHIESYLYRSVHNNCINSLKREGRVTVVPDMAEPVARTDADETVELKELQKQLAKAMDLLPEKCRLIFQLSRYEHLKYHEIASQLGLSVKTVETQMSKALSILRRELKDYLPLILFLLSFKLL